MVVEEVDEPTPGPRQVLVTVEAAAVNFPDVLLLDGRYQVRIEPDGFLRLRESPLQLGELRIGRQRGLCVGDGLLAFPELDVRRPVIINESRRLFRLAFTRG